MTNLPPPSKKKLGLVIDLDTCVGCHACAVGCKQWNSGGIAGPKARMRSPRLGPPAGGAVAKQASVGREHLAELALAALQQVLLDHRALERAIGERDLVVLAFLVAEQRLGERCGAPVHEHELAVGGGAGPQEDVARAGARTHAQVGVRRYGLPRPGPPRGVPESLNPIDPRAERRGEHLIVRMRLGGHRSGA